MEPGFIGVVGGLGRMGSFLVRLLTEAGYQVCVADADAPSTSWIELARCQVIFIAVPIPSVDKVARRIGPLTRPDGVVIDICSLKDEPVSSMLDHCRGEVIGSHPLFGPDIVSLKNQLVFVYPARTEKWLSWFSTFLTDRGARVVEIEPLEHDRLMARVQVLRHVLLLSFGLCLRRLDFDIGRHLPLSGSWFSRLVEMVSRQLAQSPELYADLAVHNPATGRVLEGLSEAVSETCRAFALRDRGAIIDLIDEVKAYLPPRAEGGTDTQTG